MDRTAFTKALSYRDKVASTVELAALVLPTTRELGAVLKRLRGALYVHRGVRNVVDLQPVRSSCEGADGAGVQGTTVVLYEYGQLRWGVDTAQLPEGSSGEGFAEPRQPLKALLLDPAVMPASAVPASAAGAGAASESVRMVPFTTVPFPSPEAAAAVLGLPPGLSARLCATAAGPTAQISTSAPTEKGSCPRMSGQLLGVTTVTVSLTYENYTMAELLRMVLPSSSTSAHHASSSLEPEVGTGDAAAAAQDQARGMNNSQNTSNELVALSGFEQVGHIAHVNLSKSHLPYRHIIGQVIIDCNPTVSVVVNKTDAISSEFREFPMEIIAVRPGEHDAAAATVRGLVNSGSGGGSGDASGASSGKVTEEDVLLTATVKQHGCVFEVPYNRVYWNSRLSHEHTRLVAMMRETDVLFDAMAGVGPFAIPAAKRGVLVFGNDLNPASAEYMTVNRAKNRIREAALTVYNWDGRDFLNKVVYDCVMGLQQLPSDRGRKHVVMNLPATAVEFLDVFSPKLIDARSEDRVELPRGHGWYRRHRWNCRPAEVPPDAHDRSLLIHVYCFSPATNPLEEAVRQVEHHLGYQLEDKNKECVFLVRDVAPQKRMVCVSFTLPDAFWAHQVAVEATGGEGGSEEGAQRVRGPRIE